MCKTTPLSTSKYTSLPCSLSCGVQRYYCLRKTSRTKLSPQSADMLRKDHGAFVRRLPYTLPARLLPATPSALLARHVQWMFRRVLQAPCPSRVCGSDDRVGRAR